MKKQGVFLLIIVFVIGAFCSDASAGKRVDMTEAMKKSIVYLKTSFYGYEPSQPWKHKGLVEKWSVGCAVGKYEILTSAWSVADVAFIKARRYGRNDFIPAKVKIVDYESNLCLITLDPNAMSKPLKPLVFSEDYKKGSEVDFYWLSAGGHLSSGRGYLDRTEVDQSNISFSKRLSYVAADTSQRTGMGQVYYAGSKAIGIAIWSNSNKEAGLIPSEIINRFLANAKGSVYKGFGAVGFKTTTLLDPTMRTFLKMPASAETGVYVSDVYTLGTGSDILEKGDVILSIDGKILNAYGRFLHPKYDRLYFDHLITSKVAGDKISFEVWRDSKKVKLEAKVKNFKASDMLVPYQEYDKQPQYIITGGFIFQNLTRPYLTEWGKGWRGKVSPHLYHYYRDGSFKPTSKRRDIVILSYVIPANINLGYHKLRQLVVKKFNGMEIGCIADIVKATQLNPESKYDVIEFELDNPVAVIPREQLRAADMLISRNYGISKLVNINE